MFERLLLLWLVLLSALAYFWPQLQPYKWDPFVASRPYLNILFGMTMLAIGSLLPMDEIRQVRQRWQAVFAGTTVQYLTMPVLAVLLAGYTNLAAPMVIGILMVGCVPGAMASNVLTLAARGNVSYSVSLTTLATLLSPVIVPFVLWITLGTAIPLNPLRVSAQLFLMVVGPVLVGHFLSRGSRWWRQATHFVGPTFANGVILWIIAVVVALNRSRLDQALGVLALVLLLLNVFGYAVGYLAARELKLPDAMRRALTLEVGMQNAGLGTVLVQGMFPNQPEVAIPPAAYTFGCMITGTILARLWARRSTALSLSLNPTPAVQQPSPSS